MLADKRLFINTQLESLDPRQPHHLALFRYSEDLLSKVIELLQYFLKKLLFDSEQIAVCNCDIRLGPLAVFQEISLAKY